MDPSCEIGSRSRVATQEFPDPVLDESANPGSGVRSAIFGGGCFWCVEAVFKEIDGVLEVVSGYAGGTADTAAYETVCSGLTDHAEVIQLRYDPARVSFGQLLKVFFSVAHDPTQLNRQGADQGRQYRSAVFYADEEQKRVAEAYIRQLGEAGVFSAPIVTEVAPREAFYEAESYHQDYAAKHPMQPYIMFTSAPKVAKLRKQYPDRLKRS